MSTSIDFSNRQTLSGVSEIFSTRWSPRAFDGSSITNEQQARIFEAARWAPSCFNDQPWHFYTSTPDSFSQFLAILAEANQTWVKNTGLIGFLTARKYFARNGKPNAFAELDCGAAWMSVALQAREEGLYAHGMGGFDKTAAQQFLQLDENIETVVMAFAIGRLVDLSTLGPEAREKEKPSGRKALNEIWFKR